MKYFFPRIETINKEVNDHICKVIEEYPEFDKIDLEIRTGHKYDAGVIEFNFSEPNNPKVYGNFLKLNLAYFPICLN